MLINYALEAFTQNVQVFSNVVSHICMSPTIYFAAACFTPMQCKLLIGFGVPKRCFELDLSCLHHLIWLNNLVWIIAGFRKNSRYAFS